MLLAGLAVVSLAATAWVADQSVMTLGRGATECHLYDAGNRFGLLFFELPLLATVMWATSLLPAFIFARRGRHAILASWFTGLLLALVIAYLYLGGSRPR
jgi:uncharacterized membrane protein